MKTHFTFDDVLIKPQYSDILPSDVNIESRLSPRFRLGMPLLSAAMDTVTESQMAISIARLGGLGVVHKNLSVEEQVAEVERVKRFEGGIVYKPITLNADMTVREAKQMQQRHGMSGFPLTDAAGKVQGIVTNRDLRFETKMNRRLGEIMTPRERLVTVSPGFNLRDVKALLHRHRIERVVIMDKRGVLGGLITVKDILQTERYPGANKDDKGRLRVAAAVGANNIERAVALTEAGADALVVDSAHGHSKIVLDTISQVRRECPDALLIAGNVATAEGARAIARAGADVIKVGIGPGSICTTRIIAGIGVPQVSAIQDVAAAAKAYKRQVAVIADGGIRYSGDIAKAIVAGADAVMLGSMLAGAEEAPGEIELYQGRAYKTYRGMGSLDAMRRGSGERYFQDETEAGKLVPEGIEGRVPFKGGVDKVLFQITGGLRAAMGYVGAADIPALKNAAFIQITGAGSRESHPHNVEITREAPNYHSE